MSGHRVPAAAEDHPAAGRGLQGGEKQGQPMGQGQVHVTGHQGGPDAVERGEDLERGEASYRALPREAGDRDQGVQSIYIHLGRTASSCQQEEEVHDHRDQGCQAQTGSCSFNLQASGFMDTCGWRLDLSELSMTAWMSSVGVNSNWMGGPPTDGLDSQAGGYAFVDLADFRELAQEVDKGRAWMVSPGLGPTTAAGHCMTFQYNINSLSLQALRMIRVDIVELNMASSDSSMPREMPRHADRLPQVRWNAMQHGTGRALDEAGQNVSLVLAKLGQMFGNNAGKLEVVVMWTQEDGTQGEWKDKDISYTTLFPHFLIIEAIPSTLTNSIYTGYAAVDSISLVQGTCDNFCSFDGGLAVCDWENRESGDHMDWSTSKGSVTAATGPTVDQARAESGYLPGGYAFIDSSPPGKPGDTARLYLSTKIKTAADEPKCLGFYVNTFGSGMGSLSVVVENNASKTTLWEVVRPQSTPRDLWSRSQVTVSAQQDADLYFEASIGEVGRGDIALDTISIQPEACVTRPPSAARFKEISCHFDDDLCGYLSQNVPDDNRATDGPQLWQRSQGRPGVMRPHRPLDFGTAAGFALFDVTNTQNGVLDRGFLIGPLIPISSEPICISFWYYMATDVPTVPHLATLRVLLIPGNSSGGQILGEPRLLWSLTNHQESAWQYAQVSFVPDTPYLMALEGIRANTVPGTVGVDDIVMFPGSCRQSPDNSAVNIGDCSFEFGLCSWKSINPGSTLELRPQDWRIANGSQSLGGLKDHTFELEARGYAFFETTNLQTKSWLVSPALNANLGYCLQFWYAAVSSATTTNLQVMRQYINGTMSSIWAVTVSDLGGTGSPAVGWRPAQIYVPELSSGSALVLEGNTNQGGFAVDDVRLRPSSRPDCETRPVFMSSMALRSRPYLFDRVGVPSDSSYRIDFKDQQFQFT